MRAIAVSEYGATPSLMDLPEPEPGPGEVQVELVAAGLNPLDWKIAEGMRKDSYDASFPLVLGVDGAGVVTASGGGDTRLRVGDRVFGSFYGTDRGLGTYAEFTVARPDDPVTRMPDDMSYVLAAALPTSGMTACGLVEQAGVGPEQTVLVIGATGGVGQNVVQLASAAGARVIATVGRPDVAERMRTLGAAETVDYRQNVNDQVHRTDAAVDVVIDLVSMPPAVERVAALLREGGTYITTVWSVNPDAMAERGLRGINYSVHGTPEALDHVADLVQSKRLRIAIEQEPPLEEAPAAVADSRAGRSGGKTVIRI
ncbi:NADP-dependent oxidoreductase [Actinomadura atramentaria]|uniref:NADP-dependent oxidoreductase n=1 Tax=Actinomadura atramentaria TaxID=1990 RepID=UPI000374B18C|nr:NADP-dependent oxidoreductase [Actinomadura atramentaria]